METTLRDLRYGFRMLRKDFRFTVVALIALMLGIASTTVIFSVINGILLRPVPYPAADRLVTVSPTIRATNTLATPLRRRIFSIGRRKTVSSKRWPRRAAGKATLAKVTRRNDCASRW